MNEKLLQFTEELEPWEDLAFELIGDNKIKMVSAFVPDNSKIAQLNDRIKVLDHKDDLNIEMSKLCAWSIGQCDGLLIPANLSIGVCCFKEKYYSFSTLEAAAEFQRNPEKYRLLRKIY